MPSCGRLTCSSQPREAHTSLSLALIMVAAVIDDVVLGHCCCCFFVVAADAVVVVDAVDVLSSPSSFGLKLTGHSGRE